MRGWVMPFLKTGLTFIGCALIFGIGCVLLAKSWLLFMWLAAGSVGSLAMAYLVQHPCSHRLQITSQDVSPSGKNTSDARQISARFLANISHECRTPLSTVIGYAECMLRGYDGTITDEQRSGLEAIVRNAKDLLQILEDVLQLAKVESGRIDLALQPFYFDECVHSVVQSVGNEVKQRHLQLEVDLPKDLPPLLGDPSKVRRIMLNLVQNAVKYTARGEITIRAKASLPYAEITVADTGPGIPGSELGRIFEPFYQGGIGKSGVGLGLSIVKSLVEAHAGRLEVHTKEGQGTTFVLLLPLAIPELKTQIRSMLEQKLEPSRREIAYRLYQWLESPEEDESWQEANALS